MSTVRQAVFEHELVRYLAAGGVNTALGFFLYVGGLRAGLPYLVANVGAWSVSIVVAFALQAVVVFKKNPTTERFLRFVAVNVSSLVVSTCALTALIHFVGLDPVAAAVLTIPIVVLLNFLAGKCLVFGRYGR